MHRRSMSLVTAVVLAFAALLSVSDAAKAQSTASCGYGTGGPFASNLCWFDMTAYSDATARSAAGQPMSINLPGGYVASFTLKSTPVPTHTHASIESRATPLENRFSFGSTGADGGYRGVPGKPALYSFGGSGVTLTLSDIEVVDSSDQPVTGYRFVVADAENNIAGEDFTWTSDKPLDLIGVLNDDATAGCNVGGSLTGIGTTTVNCDGTGAEPGPPDPRYDNVIVGADTPSTIGLSMTTFARSGIAFGILTSKIEVRKSVAGGRMNPSDSFDVFATSPEGSEVARASTGSADTASTGELTVLPRTNGASYTLGEESTPGSGTRLSDYRQSWSCTNNGSPYTSTGPADGASVSVSPEVGDDIECTVTNTSPARPLQTCPTDDLRATQRWWFFGARGGIDFDVSGTSATPILNPQNISSLEGTTVVTDTAGRLRFWSNGHTVYNANHQAMPNGTGLAGNSSATQTVAAFPALDDPNKYFVITTSADVSLGSLRYSVVDMSLNGGLGGVTATKNVFLGTPGTASEALTAVPNSDGTGFWVLTYTPNSPNVLAYEFDSSGPVTGTAVVSAMPTNNLLGYGTLNVSPDLSELVAMTGNNAGSSRVRLLSFDADTGEVRQKLEWETPSGTGAGRQGYSAEFSPSGDYVYATRIFGGGRLYRYRIAGNSTGAEVKATELNVGSIGANGGQIKRGPDGRMYVANHNGTALSVVGDPDSSSTNVGFASGGFALPAGAGSRFGLPQLVTGCPIPPESDLQLEKSASPTTAEIGDNVTFTLDVLNDGPDASPAVTLTDELPAGLEHVSDDSGCNVTALPTITCNLGAMADGDTRTVQIVARVRDSASNTTIENNAVVSGPNVDPAPGNNDDPASVNIGPAADLALTKSADPSVVDPGDQLTYELRATNNGPNADAGATITDTLPAEVTYVSDDASCDTSSLPQLSCPIGGLANGASRAIHVTVQANLGTGGTFPTNNALVTGTSTDPDPDDNDAQAQVRIRPLADLELEKSATPSVADPDGSVTYSLTVSNHGPSDSPSATIADTLPGGVAYASDDAGCDTSNLPQLSCPVPAIPDGGSHTIQVTVVVDTGAGNTTQTNSALVTGALNDPEPGNNGANADIFVTPVSNLSVDKTAPATATASRELTYTINYANDGPSASPAPTTISDTLPAGVSYVSDNRGCDTSALPQISCEVGPVADGGTGTIEIVVAIDIATRGEIENIVEIDGPNTDPDTGDNNDDATTDVGPPLTDLGVVKDANPGVVDPGDPVAYTLTVTNHGDDPSPSAEVTDTLPSGVSYISDDAGCDTSALPKITCPIGALADDATEAIHIDVEVDSGAGGTVQTNTATVSGPGEDANGDNDTDTAETQVTPLSDLSIDKSASPTVRAGNQLTYTLDYANAGPTDSDSTAIVDTLPNGVTYVSDNAGCDTSGLPQVSCDVGTVASGAGGRIEIVVAVGSGTLGQVINSATIDGSNVDLDPANNSDDATTQVVAGVAPAPASTERRCFFGHRVTIVGTKRADVIKGTPGRDVINGLGGNDRIYGLGGNDLICGGAGNDLIVAGQGDDGVKGSTGNDRIFGNGGSDWLRGSRGNDRIKGGRGPDRIMGNRGNDRLWGNRAGDILLGGPGLDWGFGGPGLDEGFGLAKAFGIDKSGKRPKRLPPPK